MIRRQGTIFEKFPAAVKTTDNKSGDVVGDSEVGQASEFPTRSPETLIPQLFRFRYTSIILSRCGTGLLIFGLLGFLLTFGPILRVEIGYRLSRLFTKPQQPKNGFAELLNKEMIGEVEGVPDPNFSLIIPKIHAKSKVVANVDPGNEAGYLDVLKTGIAHAKGTFFPGGQGNIYLFAHSTDNPINILRYNAVFYLLKELVPGDEVEVFFGGIKHRYIVTDQKIVEPTDTSNLTPYNSDNREQLILQTCWPPGTTLKRLLVFAKKP